MNVILKRIGWLALGLATILALVFLALQPAQAADSDNLLQYKDIGTHITKNNAQLEILKNTLTALQTQRSDIADSNKNSLDDLYDGRKEYRRILDAAQDALVIASQMPEDTIEEKQAKQAAMAAANGSIMSAQTFLASADMNIYMLEDASYDSIDLQIAKLKIQVDQTAALLTKSAQNLFGSYQQLQAQMKLVELNRPLLEEALRLAKLQLELGLGNKLGVTEAEMALEEFDVSLAQLKNQSDQLFKQLKQLLGWPQNQLMLMGPLPTPNREYIKNINLTEDTKTAVEKSYALKSYQQEYNFNADNTDQQYVIKLSMAQTEENISLELRNQQTLIKEKETAYDLAEKQLNTGAEKLKLTRIQYELGVLTKLALQQEENNYETLKSAANTARSSLFMEIENYKALLDGLAGTSTGASQ